MTGMTGRSRLKRAASTLEVRGRVCLAIVLAGHGVGLAVNISEVRWIIGHEFSRLTYAKAAITYDVDRLAMTLGHLGALMLFLRAGLLPWLSAPWPPSGEWRLPIIYSNALAGPAAAVRRFGLFGTFERHQLCLIVLAIWIAQLVLSPIWRSHYRLDPAEWLRRYLTIASRRPSAAAIG